MPGIFKATIILGLTLALTACGHSQSSRIGLMSFGELEGKVIPDSLQGPTRQGTVTSGAGGSKYYLSEAVREALKDSEYDTLVNVEVTAETGLLVWSNTLSVRGTAVNSKKLDQPGGGGK